MRKIKFRAQGRASGNWYYGYLTYQSKHYCIVEENGNVVEIDPRTIGQYTGLQDCEGKEIYGGDIVSDGIEKGFVYFDNNYSQFRVSLGEGCNGNTPYNQGGSPKGETRYKVIGNIHEDKELLETENEE